MTTLTETITDELLDSIGEDSGLDTVLANYHGSRDCSARDSLWRHRLLRREIADSTWNSGVHQATSDIQRARYPP